MQLSNVVLAVAVSVVLFGATNSVLAQGQQSTGVVRAGVGHTGPGKLVKMSKNEHGQKKNKMEADDQQPAAGTAEAAIRAYEKKVSGSQYEGTSGTITALNDAEINGALKPGLKLYVLRYRMWPVARAVPPPLQTNNIFALDDKNNIVAVVSDEHNAQMFFSEHARTVESEQQARTAMATWLRMQQELAQDGMYIFHMSPETFVVQKHGADVVVSGSTSIEPKGGDSGEISSKMTFSKGRIARSDTDKKLKSGMRPICQSTKLLDKDPLVRRMAEQDILVMGRRCKFYLDDQRTKVSPALQKAIDKIWLRIEKENR